MKIETVDFTLPDFWASYLVNRDSSGLTKFEVNEINACLHRLAQQVGGSLLCVSCDDEPTFSIGSDWNGISGMNHRFTFHVQRRANG